MPWGRKSHFFCTVDGSRVRQERIAGDAFSGIRVVAAGWKGAVVTTLRYSQRTQRDEFTVFFEPWHKSTAQRGCITLATGVLDFDVVGPQLAEHGPLVRLDSDVLAALEFIRAQQIMMEGCEPD